MIDIGKLIDLIKDPDLKIKINDLYTENLQLKEENFSLRKKIEGANKAKELKGKLLHEDNHYFIIEGENKDGPFCTKCFDADDKTIRLHKGNNQNGVQYYNCPNCNTRTSVGTYIPVQGFGGTDW